MKPASDPAIMATGDGMWCVDGSESSSEESVELVRGAEDVFPEAVVAARVPLDFFDDTLDDPDNVALQ